MHYFYLPAFPVHPLQQRLGDKSVSLQNRKTVGWLASLMSYKLQGFYLAASLAVHKLMQGAAVAGDRIITVIALGENS